MKISNTASSTTEWVHCDLQHHWHSKQFKCQEKSAEVSEKRDTAQDWEHCYYFVNR